MARLTRTAAATAALVALGAPLAACGSSDESTPTPTAVDLGPAVTAPGTPSAGPIPDAATLQAALPAATDLPAGYARLPAIPDLGAQSDSEPGTDRSTTNPSRCANVADTVARQVPGAVASAEENFTGAGFTSIDVDAAAYAGTGAADAFAAVQDTLRECTTFTGTDADGTSVQYRVEPLPQPTVGDASTSIRLTTTSGGFTLVSDVVLAVVDSTVVQVIATGPDGTDGSVATDVARTTADRVHAAAPAR
ncbi:hypothetical protein [Prescottella agglutinans]|uniref:Sensor domain-containing protein n=1 Tax=Prescottella agglutinans TaxID=1644129 RepID=A0ABT6M5U2_9NOCA|nr:hypothetical protein [Prescottella agglutinans]MDH6279678.1 hypothetical protein [Prescottella agglutinans]